MQKEGGRRARQEERARTEARLDCRRSHQEKSPKPPVFPPQEQGGDKKKKWRLSRRRQS